MTGISPPLPFQGIPFFHYTPKERVEKDGSKNFEAGDLNGYTYALEQVD
jgi:hypothetical protein